MLVGQARGDNHLKCQLLLRHWPFYLKTHALNVTTNPDGILGVTLNKQINYRKTKCKCFWEGMFQFRSLRTFRPLVNPSLGCLLITIYRNFPLKLAKNEHSSVFSKCLGANFW